VKGGLNVVREAHRLWLEANRAEIRGEHAVAERLFVRILKLYPHSREAVDASYYLETQFASQPLPPIRSGPH
jgi:hypothetical protein